MSIVSTHVMAKFGRSSLLLTPHRNCILLKREFRTSLGTSLVTSYRSEECKDLLINQLTNNTWRSASQKVVKKSAAFMEPDSHYRVHNNPSGFFILNSTKSIYIFPSRVFNIYFNITLPSMPNSFPFLH